jgi:hypothetical protein
LRTALLSRSLFCMVGLAVATYHGECGRALAEAPKIDTEHLFGFLTGTDIGEDGDKEIESETTGRFNKRTGSYSSLSQKLAVEYTPAQNFRLEMGAIFGYHAVSGVSGLDDVRRGAFQGLSLEMRYRLLARERSPFGLAFLAEPHWSRIDDASGQQANQYGAGFAILVDKELIQNRAVAALNFLYEPDTTQSRITGAWSRNATVGVSTALMAQVHPGVLIGAEARYLRAYDSLGLDRFTGHALYFGPNVFVKPSERWRITASWSSQIAGKAVSDPASLDLTNFTRHQVKLRIGYQF